MRAALRLPTLRIQDLINRLEPIAHEMERQREPLLVVAHQVMSFDLQFLPFASTLRIVGSIQCSRLQAILRVLYAYFTGMRREDCVKVSIPLNMVIKITPTSTGFNEERFHPIGDCTLAPPLLDPASH